VDAELSPLEHSSTTSFAREYGSASNTKKHILMIDIEADVLAGPLLARNAKEAGIIYSMAYVDQPALIAKMVD
jgi:predicted homoserine dehydrogenase-like protein